MTLAPCISRLFRFHADDPPIKVVRHPRFESAHSTGKRRTIPWLTYYVNNNPRCSFQALHAVGGHVNAYKPGRYIPKTASYYSVSTNGFDAAGRVQGAYAPCLYAVLCLCEILPMRLAYVSCRQDRDRSWNNGRFLFVVTGDRGLIPAIRFLCF